MALKSMLDTFKEKIQRNESIKNSIAAIIPSQMYSISFHDDQVLLKFISPNTFNAASLIFKNYKDKDNKEMKLDEYSFSINISKRFTSFITNSDRLKLIYEKKLIIDTVKLFVEFASNSLTDHQLGNLKAIKAATVKAETVKQVHTLAKQLEILVDKINQSNKHELTSIFSITKSFKNSDKTSIAAHPSKTLSNNAEYKDDHLEFNAELLRLKKMISTKDKQQAYTDACNLEAKTKNWPKVKFIEYEDGNGKSIGKISERDAIKLDNLLLKEIGTSPNAPKR